MPRFVLTFIRNHSGFYCNVSKQGILFIVHCNLHAEHVQYMTPSHFSHFNEQVIPFQNLWREQRGADCPDCPSITFVAQASESHLSDWHRGSFRATVRLFQQDHDSEGISFIVRANPDKMATFVFKVIED